jgi:peptide/nickel transport system permease protein
MHTSIRASDIERARWTRLAACRGWIAGNPVAFVAALFLGLMLVFALFAPWLGTIDPQKVAPTKRLQLPSRDFWLGTDFVGRDLYSRIVYGARVSLAVGFACAALSSLMGLALGIFTGLNRIADAILMRVMDGVMSIPTILLAIALATLGRPSIGNVVAAITFAETPRVARLMRSVVMGLREQAFVEAAITLGTRLPLLIWRHILPNVVSTLAVQASYICAAAMIIEAVLSFLGAGVPQEIPSWGNIIASGRNVFQIRPTIVLFPGLFLSLTILSINILGNALRDWLEPRATARL